MSSKWSGDKVLAATGQYQQMFWLDYKACQTRPKVVKGSEAQSHALT
jgi:hypothetical protein